MTEDKQASRCIKWRLLVEEQARSGLSQKTFCQERNLVLSTFTYYRCLFKREEKQSTETTGSFKPIKLFHQEINTSEVRITLPNGFDCSFPAGFEISQLKALMEVLLSC